MPWATSDRRQRLPRDWSQRVARVKRRDRGLCQWPVAGGICGRPGRDVDHRTDPDNHDDLWLLCKPHHDAKTRRESAAARAARPRRERSPERHPGLV